MWGPKAEYEKMTKALLGDYFDHLLWRPAFQSLISQTLPPGAWFTELTSITSENFVARKREEIGRLYSALSKGIHHEFVLPPGAAYDRSTIEDLILRSIHLTAELGLISHFVPHALCCLSSSSAMALFSQIEAVEVWS